MIEAVKLQFVNKLIHYKLCFLILERFWFYWLAFFGIILVRYFLIVGGMSWFFNWTTGKLDAKLRRKPQHWQSVRQDIKLSVLSTVLFALCAAFVMSEYDAGATLLYTSLHKYGLWYLGISFIAVLLLQDTYFYFVHRAFHHPLLFKQLHYGHHRSGEPTPWTSFAFDLPEALVQGLFFVAIVFLVPLHFIVLIAVLLTMTVWAVLTHLGFELSPASVFPQWIGRWFIGSKYHLLHHRKYKVHYGLYFTFWDQLLGTDSQQ